MEVIPVGGDDQGVDPQRLRKILQDRRASRKRMPKAIYLNVTGSNPTGSVMPLERRKEIYRLACEYNFLILDDDPYHFMYFTEVSFAIIHKLFPNIETILAKQIGKFKIEKYRNENTQK